MKNISLTLRSYNIHILFFPLHLTLMLFIVDPPSMFMILHIQPGRSFNVTRYTKESLNLPLFLPVPHTHLIFTPSRYPDESSLGPFDPKPPRGSVRLIHEGQITDYDMRYRGLITLGRNGTVNEVVIARLTSRHDGVYDIRDRDGNLVSTTLLQVIGELLDVFKCPIHEDYSVSKKPHPCVFTPHRERRQMEITPQVHHRPVWHVCVTGRLHPVHEAIPQLQPLSDHHWPQTKPHAAAEPSEGQHPGEKKQYLTINSYVTPVLFNTMS